MTGRPQPAQSVTYPKICPNEAQYDPSLEEYSAAEEEVGAPEESMSILEGLGIPNEVGTLLFALAVALSLVPYLAGVELGPLKVPNLPNKVHSRFKWLGPLLVIVSIALFLPILPTAKLELVDKAIAPDGTIQLKLLNNGKATAYITRANFSVNAVCVFLPQRAFIAALNPSHDYAVGIPVLPPPVICRLPLSQVVKESEAEFFTIRAGIDQSFFQTLTRKRWNIFGQMQQEWKGRGLFFMVGPDEEREWNARFERTLTPPEKQILNYLRLTSQEIEQPRDICVDFSLSLTYNHSEGESIGRFIFCDGYSRHFGVNIYATYPGPGTPRNQQLARQLQTSSAEKNDLAASIIQAVLSGRPGA